jgi:hypothetical protein
VVKEEGEMRKHTLTIIPLNMNEDEEMKETEGFEGDHIHNGPSPVRKEKKNEEVRAKRQQIT